MAKISNVRIYGFEESILASGYSYMTEEIDLASTTPQEKDYKRCCKLGPCKGGEGHSQFLHGIHVDFDLTFSLQAWPEMQRYHFVEFVSSYSKMHCLKKFKMEEKCNEFVDPEIMRIAQEHIDAYNTAPCDLNFYRMIYNVPSGFELTARLSTNYESLKTIYRQRRGHKLKPDWSVFCDWVETLPYFEEFIDFQKK